MKKVFSILTVVVLSVIMMSCSKDKDAVQTPAYVVEGKYSGQIKATGQILGSQFAMQIKSGGALQRVEASGAVTANGSWSLSGTTFTGYYENTTGVKVTLEGSLNKEQRKISGDWSSTNGNTGTFYATKE